MNNKEILYEISLKYNTLKMYENTIDQMKKNGIGNDGALASIINEKEIVEEELQNLLKTDDIPYEPYEKSNQFVKKVTEDNKYRDLYSSDKNFFAEMRPIDSSKEVLTYRKAEISEDKKPKFSDIQEKISNSQWISCSNFIVEFPKDKIDIDEWRISGFFYRAKPRMCCSSEKCSVNGGELIVTVNDFAEKREDGTYNILANIVNDLSMKSKAYVVGDIYARIINNNGEELYSMRFKNCRFISSDADGFNYETTSLRKVILQFEYDEIIILEPDEAAN